MPSESPPGQPPVGSPPATPKDREIADLLIGLTSALADAEQLIGGLGVSPSEGSARPAANDLPPVARGLARRLEAAESDRRELTTRLVEAERRAERLMTLYVATYHLHATLDPPGVEEAIAEIAVDLLGARRFQLLLEEPDGSFRVAMDRTAGHRGDAAGDEAGSPLFAAGRYRGGDPMIDATLADGVLRIAGADRGAESGESPAVATVPLNLGGQTAGVLVISELVEQKRALNVEDRDLLDLLAAHAASALTAAQLFSVSERKLHTFRSLIELARRGGPAGVG
ncbi:MAG TPA: GAF domain-containing protein [Thermoanaerobaculia bacterium]|nr:GAF domain-containing protein [Thermoanaerobaculia bacterium]